MSVSWLTMCVSTPCRWGRKTQTWASARPPVFPPGLSRLTEVSYLLYNQRRSIFLEVGGSKQGMGPRERNARARDAELRSHPIFGGSGSDPSKIKRLRLRLWLQLRLISIKTIKHHNHQFFSFFQFIVHFLLLFSTSSRSSHNGMAVSSIIVGNCTDELLQRVKP